MAKDSGRYVRPLICLFLLYGAYRSLQVWYDARHSFDYFLFSSYFLAAIAFAAPVFELPRLKRFWPLILILFALPYGEWFRINYASSREDWTRQLFTQFLFLYAVFIVIALFSSSLSRAFRLFLKNFDRLSEHRALSSILIPSVFACLCGWIALYVFRQAPLVQDTTAHLFQAKIFASGHLAAPIPPSPQFFQYTGDMLVQKSGHWTSMYPPGFALLLMLPLSIGIEYWIGPLLGTITVLLWIKYAQRWYGKRVALVFAVLSLFSPFLFLMFSTLMVHAPELFLASAILFLCRLESEKPSKLNLAALALLLLLAVLVRGFSILPFLLPALFYLTWLSLRKKSFAFPAFAFVGLIIGFTCLFYYQKEVYGGPLLSGYFIEYPGLKYGFGKTWLGMTHTPSRAFEQLSNNLLGLNHWLTGWYSGAFFFVLVSLMILPRFDQWDYVLLAGCAALAVFYFFQIAQDLVIGPRFFFLMAPIGLLLIARIFSPELDDSRTVAIRLALLCSFLAFLPVRFGQYVRMYDSSGSQWTYLRNAIEADKQKKLLIFLAREVDQSLIAFNDPLLRADCIFCRDLGNNGQAIASFSDRAVRFFRLDVGYPKTGYNLYPNPRGADEPPISLFQLALVVQGTSGDSDIFDTSYHGFLLPVKAEMQHAFLLKELKQSSGILNYREKLQQGLIHLGLFLILPGKAFADYGPEWGSRLDYNELKSEFELAYADFLAAGEAGKVFIPALDRVRHRIDSNEDGRWSNEETERFLHEKLQLAETD